MRAAWTSPLFFAGLLLGILGTSFFASRSKVPERPVAVEQAAPVEHDEEKPKETLPQPCLPVTSHVAASPTPPAPKLEPHKPEPKPQLRDEEYVQAQRGESESFPFSAKALYKTTMCEGDQEWFVTNGYRTYFAAEPDAMEKSTELVGTIVSNSLQRSELALLHCLKPSYKGWRVRIVMQVKAESVRNGRAIIRKWNPDGTEARALNQMTLAGTFDWKPFTFPVIVSAESFAFGFEMIGSGKLFIKDVRVIRAEDTHLFD